MCGLPQSAKGMVYSSGLLQDSISVPYCVYTKEGLLGFSDVSCLCSNTRTAYDVSCLVNVRLPQTSGCVAVTNSASSPHNY